MHPKSVHRKCQNFLRPVGQTNIVLRIVLALSLITFVSGCSNLFFFPTRALVRTPEQVGLVYEDVYFQSGDGIRLNGWFLPATSGQPIATVLLLHGNAQNISTHLASVDWLPAQGFNVFLFDYRGYGLSQGQPTFPGAIADSEAALALLSTRSDLRCQPIILFGQSLGAAFSVHVAAHSAHRSRLAGVLVDSAFADYRLIYRDVAAQSWLTWWLQWPWVYAIDNRYSPLLSVSKISPLPIFVLHSEQDMVIPVEHSRLLYSRAQEPKTLLTTERGTHISSTLQPDVRSVVVDWFRTQASRPICADSDSKY